jgi:hypothetical protein
MMIQTLIVCSTKTGPSSSSTKDNEVFVSGAAKLDFWRCLVLYECVGIYSAIDTGVGRTSSLHYYYLAFIVLTYLAYIIAVNTSYRSSLGTLQTQVYKPLLH